MIARTLAPFLRAAARKYPIITLTGPRQSGKTTLVRGVFQRHAYASLELPDVRQFAREDPRGFLASLDGPVILDEVQRAPDLFSYLQAEVDEAPRPGRFILTGSQNFLLLEKISQSLAGRCAVAHLLPFSLAELLKRRPVAVEALGREVPGAAKPRGRALLEVLFTGLYPRIHDRKLPARDWLASYCMTYLERDVRSVVNVGDLEAFGRFLRLCAGRTGQLLNMSSLGNDCGVTHTTINRWISILEASFIIVLLRPHHQNLGKRLIKAPKLHFLDTGLACYLLGIRGADDLASHPLRGALFESFVVAELYKSFVHRGEPASLFFWRDARGNEVDSLIDLGSVLIPVEVKSAQTLGGDAFSAIDYWRRLHGEPDNPAAIVYAGERAFKRAGVVVRPWFAL